MSDEELGLDTLTKPTETRRFVTLPEARGTKRKLELELELEPDPIAHQRAIVCRGTSCFRTKTVDAAEFDIVVKYPWTSSMRPPEADFLKKANDRGVKGIAKLVAYQEEVTSISKLREDLVFFTPHKFRGVPRSAHMSSSQSQPPLSYCSDPFAERGEGEVTYSVQVLQGTTSLVKAHTRPYDNRNLRVLAVSPAGRSISQFRSVADKTGYISIL